MNMIAAVRLSANGLESGMESGPVSGGGGLRVSLTDALRVAYRNLEGFMTGHADAIAEAVSRGVEAFARRIRRERPGTGCPRKSGKPLGKWARS